jgi:regulator of sigma E protease
MLGGVIVNFLLALFIYIIVFFKWGEEYVPVDRLIYGYSFEQEFQDLGLQNGDKVLALDGEVVDRWRSIHHDIVVNDPRVIQVERDGVIMDIQVPEGMTATLLKLEYVMEPRVPCEVDGMAEDGGMALAGVELNDRIIGVNGTPIQFYDEFKDMTRKEINTSFDLALLRGTDTVQVQASTDENGMFGISRKVYYDFYETVVVKYSLIQSIPAGINRGFEITGSYLKQLKMLFKPETKAYEELGGFIKIGSIFPSTWNWERFWNMTAFLSIILAIMNVLPIPALDGGHVMFLMFEIITGRKPGDKFMEYAQIVGMILLLSLLLYANLNDIIGLFKN